MARRKTYNRRTAPPDPILLASSAVLASDGKTLVYPPWARAESLAPNLRTMDNYIAGDERARAIIESWRPTFVIVIV